MDEFERMRLVGDAVVLERAIGVMVRRFGETVRLPVLVEDVAGMRAVLFNMALGLRGQAEKAESGVPVR
jgi:hypothetical protein